MSTVSRSIYESPVRKQHKDSFFTTQDPQWHTHVYRTHKKDIRHMETSPDLLAHKEHTPSKSPMTKCDMMERIESGVKARYGSALKPRYCNPSFGD